MEAPPRIPLQQFAASFSSMARQVGTDPVVFSRDEAEALRGRGVTWAVENRRADLLGRVSLLLAASNMFEHEALRGLIEDAYRHGDTREREAILVALSLLPSPERFLALGIDACRSHVQPVFEAIACANPYPAGWFPELNFNQMVLKCLFLSVPIERVLGLEERRTPELARMVLDYARERRAAGRSIPEDVYRLIPERSSP